MLPERHRSRTIKGLFICQGCGSATHCEVFYVTVWNPALCLTLYLTARWWCHVSDVQHVGDVISKKIKFHPIRTREIGGVTLSDVLFAVVQGTNWKSWRVLMSFENPSEFFLNFLDNLFAGILKFDSLEISLVYISDGGFTRKFPK